jgi:acetoin utilization protein AcuB
MSEDLVSIGWGDSMAAAATRMEKLRIRHLAVTGDKGEIVGLLSDRDVQRAMNPTISLDDAGMGVYSEVDRFDPDSRVRHFMSWPPKTIDSKVDLREVATRMLHEKISCLLVMEGDQTIGIVTTDDLLRFLAEPR